MFVLIFALFLVFNAYVSGDENEQRELWLMNEKMKLLMSNYQQNMWNRMTNDTDSTRNQEKIAGREYWEAKHDMFERTKNTNWTSLNDGELKRQFDLYSRDYLSTLTEEQRDQFQHIIERMFNLHLTTSIELEKEEPWYPLGPVEFKYITPKNNNMTAMKLGIVDLFLSWTRGEKEEPVSRYIWFEWKKAIGTEILPLFKQYNSIVRNMAHTNGFEDPVEMLMRYDELDESTMQEMDGIWEHKLKPLYLKIHSFIRYILHKLYKTNEFTNQLIPDNLFYNVYADKEPDILNPLQCNSTFDIISRFIGINERYADCRGMANEVDQLYESLNLPKLPQECKAKSIFVSDELKEYVEIYSGIDYNFYLTHKSFQFNNTYRLFIESYVSIPTFGLIATELAKIQSMMATEGLPFILRPVANINSVILQAIVGTMAMIATSPTYFKNSNLVPDVHWRTDDIPLHLLRQYFDVLHKFPLIIATEKWWEQVLRGEIDESNLNEEYWNKKMGYQGINRPVEFEKNNFDDTTENQDIKHSAEPEKYSLDATTEYQDINHSSEPKKDDFDAATDFTIHSKNFGLPIKSSISTIIQFQFFQALCVKAGQFDPNNVTLKQLYECDFTHNEDATNLLRSVLELGNSKPWREMLELMTGSAALDIQPIINYFLPAIDFLSSFEEEFNITILNASVGGDEDEPWELWLMNEKMKLLMSNYQQNMWNRMTNDTDSTRNQEKIAGREYWEAKHDMFERTKITNWMLLKDGELKRQYDLYSRDYLSTLSNERKEQFLNIIEQMFELHRTTMIEIPYKRSSRPVDPLEYKHVISNYNDTADVDLGVVVGSLIVTRTDKLEPMSRYAWLKWKKAIGTETFPLFKQYNSIVRDMARSNDFQDPVKMLMSYDELDENTMQEMHEIWEYKLKPLYVRLHSFMRHILQDLYLRSEFTFGLIPDHLFYNGYSNEKPDILNPTDSPSLYEILIEYINMDERYSESKEIVNTINQFYALLKLPKLSQECIGESNFPFVNLSEYLDDSSGIEENFYLTHKSFQFNNTYRLFIESYVSIPTFGLIATELAKIQSMMATEGLPFILQPVANINSVILQAIVGTMAMLTTTPAYFKTLKIVPIEMLSANDFPVHLLRQYFDVLHKFPLIIAMEKWWEQVLRGEIDESNLNEEYWNKKMEYQGVKHPAVLEKDNFDAATDFTIHFKNLGLPIKSSISTIIQFQFFQALCVKAGQFDPNNVTLIQLYECDFTHNEEAINLLRSVLQLGNSKSWREMLELMTGSPALDIQPIINYFLPATNLLSRFEEEHDMRVSDWKVIDFKSAN